MKRSQTHNSSKMILILGLSGVGKTTVIKKLLERLPNFEEVTFGDYIFQIGKQRGLGTTRDGIRRNSSEEEYKKLQIDAAKEITREIASKKVILNSHAIVNTSSGILPGFPMSVLKHLKPDQIILIISSSREIILRRNSQKRDRDDMNEKMISHLIDFSEWITEMYSFYTGAPMLIVENKQGRLDNCVDEILNGIKKLNS